MSATLKLDIEYAATGPLAHVGTRNRLVEAVDKATDLHDALRLIQAIPRLAVYRGGSHMAVHEGVAGALGTMRLAIITEAMS